MLVSENVRGFSCLYFSFSWRDHQRMSLLSIRVLIYAWVGGTVALVVASSTCMSEPAREDVLLVEREDDDRVNLLLILFIILQNINKKNKTRGMD